MILEIDAGNSRIKWRILGMADHQPIESGVVENEEALLARIRPETTLLAARLSCVRGDAAIAQLQAWVEKTWNFPLQVARVTRECAGVRNQYEELSRLGVDRWLAMLAAFNKAMQACVVVDAGTALTIDVLDEQGTHQGGFILPGRKLMAKVIQDNTRIRLQNEPAPSIALGHGTEAAVCNGIYASQVALIEKVLREHTGQSGGIKLYLAGGDAAALSQLISDRGAFRTEIVADLVLDGLAFACPVGGD